jgi:transcriptional regulator with GAF, ATPase, and Fis domain
MLCIIKAGMRRLSSKSIIAIPDELIESELFATLGAFTGATQHKVENLKRPTGNTLLDEVGDMSLVLSQGSARWRSSA